MQTNSSTDNRVHVSGGEAFTIGVTGNPVEIQWRTWDMRDNWMDHSEFDTGQETVEISHSMIVDRLRYLPGNEIEGNQTLMVRAISGENASTNLVIHLFIVGSEKLVSETDSMDLLPILVIALSILVVVLLTLLTVVFVRIRADEDLEYDDEIDEEYVEDAEILEEDAEEIESD